MKDFDPEELSQIEYVREKFLETAQIFGFSLMDPSPIESLSTLEAKSGPAIREEIYFFKDKGEREIALRFDFTVGLTRYVASQKSLKLPAKLGSFGGVWRYDEPQKGRYRFFHQWNIELFGKPSLESESEVIEFTSRLFERLGLKNIVIEINHRKLVESFVRKTPQTKSSFVDDKILADSFRLIDKVAKKSRDELIKEYEESLGHQFTEKLLDFANIKGNPEEIEKKIDVSSIESWDYLKRLWNSLHNRGISNIRINFGIVRGLDYYSGTVFEVFDDSSDLGALAGGGRYDALTEAFGRNDIGATGVAGGVERIILTMKDQGIENKRNMPRVSVLYVNDEMLPHAMNLASKLRQAKIPTLVDLVGRQLKKQMDAASESVFSIIVAPTEFAEKKIVLRNMKDGNESKINLSDLVANPKSYLQL